MHAPVQLWLQARRMLFDQVVEEANVVREIVVPIFQQCPKRFSAAQVVFTEYVSMYWLNEEMKNYRATAAIHASRRDADTRLSNSGSNHARREECSSTRL